MNKRRVRMLLLVVALLSLVPAYLHAYKITGAVVGLRPSEEDERKGLDIVEHGEQAYDM